MLKKIGRFFKFIWNGVTFLKNLTTNFIFIILVLFVISISLFKSLDTVAIEKNSALLLSIKGNVVEQKSYEDPLSSLSDEDDDLETKLSDILKVIKSAKNDKRISCIVLDLKGMGHCGMSKLQDIGKELTLFKRSQKKIYAVGDYYSQGQYYLAAHADKIIMNPYGQVILSGFGNYKMFFEKALKKLMITFHIFRVGKYKSAIEPFIRNDMSREAKKANYAYLSDLWVEYKRDVAKLRKTTPEKIDSFINNLDTNLKTFEGNTAKMAYKMGFVDSLYPRDITKGFLYKVTKTPKSKSSYNKVTFKNYLSAINTGINSDSKKVAVLIAKGSILDGKQKEGKIGGDSFSALIRKARKNTNVKAIVIRVDSGGGSAFASELIRREVEITRKKGIPVVVSMGSVAASGGYWMSASANEIWASPTTITGSIGIFGAFPTFEKTLNYLGINNDGVGTNKISGAFDPTRPLNPVIASYLQQTIDKGYQDFLKIVSKGRKLPLEQVKLIAQGRVWSGKKALTLGLVDKLGSLSDAVASAAKLAKLDKYEAIEIKRDLTKQEQFFKNLSGTGIKINISGKSPLSKFIGIVEKEASVVLDMNDPKNLYAKCLTCE
ncbi:MAG: signal peptide peptidase SppA [Deltaproteobacteria bacterium]|nr:signal peptide peptidase SppA [Deltaproteobacteria bacterium]